VPVPGTLVVRATGASADDGAYVFELAAISDPAAVTAARPQLQLFARPSGAGLRVAVFGPLAGGDLVRFAVPDVRDSARYAVQLLDAAATDGAVRSAAERSAILLTSRPVP
jgi:hypothetical protein